MSKPKRSAAMVGILNRLEAMQPPEPRYSAAWLGRNLNPPVSRQTVSEWFNVPEHYVRQVSTLLGLDPEAIRPDLAAIFTPAVPKQAKPSRKKAA